MLSGRRRLINTGYGRCIVYSRISRRKLQKKKSHSGNFGAIEALLYNTAATATVDSSGEAETRGFRRGGGRGDLSEDRLRTRAAGGDGGEREQEVVGKRYPAPGLEAYRTTPPPSPSIPGRISSPSPEWMSQIPLNTGQTSKSNWSRHAVMAGFDGRYEYDVLAISSSLSSL
ncbi:hypothetical protein RRG08_046749 [Elysia crispata]|uniref:Uncharacterized protein n=1 Tax=Elysia crispata TaxID=231223 RepID=A0AAE0ZWS8_9GAST|nr:hypothetical protein RRG08_046749 [Elysia crispata]